MYRKALSQKQNDPDIHFNLGMLYMEQQDWGLAVTSFVRSVELSSGEKKAGALIQKGRAELNRSDTLAAREDLNQAILLDPKNELARINYFKTFTDQSRQLEELNKIYRLNNRSFFGEQSILQLVGRETKLNQCVLQTLRIFSVIAVENVKVLGKPWISMRGHGIPANNHIVDLMFF